MFVNAQDLKASLIRSDSLATFLINTDRYEISFPITSFNFRFLAKQVDAGNSIGFKSLKCWV